MPQCVPGYRRGGCHLAILFGEPSPAAGRVRTSKGPRAKRTEQEQKTFCSRIWQSKIQNRKSKIVSPDHLVRPVKHRLRNRETDLLGRFEIDHQLKLHRLL